MGNLPEIELHGYHTFSPAAWVLAEGEDAHEFLQSQFSNDLNDLKIGQDCYGLWLDQKGKVHGDSQILRTGQEKFFLFSYHTPETQLLEKLNSFIVADDVDLDGLTEDVEAISFLGNAVGVLKAIVQPTDESNKFLFEEEEGNACIE